MIRVGAGGTLGGAGADFFWKWKTGAPGDIDLKTANGVTGIDAVNPQDPRIKLLLGLFGGVLPIGGFIFKNGNRNISVSVNTQAGGDAGLTVFDDVLSDYMDVSVQSNFTGGQEASDGIDIANNILSKTSNDDTVGDLSTGENVQENRNKNQHATLIQDVGAVTTIQEILDKNRWSIKDAASVIVFAIGNDGKVRTNQTAAPGVHAVLAAELPIYDAAGVLVGYIPIFT